MNYPKLAQKAFNIYYSNTLDFIIELVKRDTSYDNKNLKLAIEYLKFIKLNIKYLTFKNKLRILIFKINPKIY